MDMLIILYPKDFLCFSKFCRKVSRIIQNLRNYSVILSDDPNGFISSFFVEKFPDIKLLKKEVWINEDVTHAIIFDDGEEFAAETEAIKKKGIPMRFIKIPITRVVNIKIETKYQRFKSTSTYEYIGRGSYWGNPYSMYEEGDDREEVIRKFKYDFDNNMFPNKDKSEVFKLSGKRLGCFCKPKSCHGDVLSEYLNSWDDGK